MLIPTDTLVLVGDGRKALFLRNRGGAGHPEFITERVMEQNNPATRDQGTDKPGRYAGPDGASRSAMEGAYNILRPDATPATAANSFNSSRRCGRPPTYVARWRS